MKRIFLLFALTAFGILAGANEKVLAEVIATITEDVETEFGTYHPNPVQITPQAKPYTVASDFGNVTNFANFRFSEDARALLQKNSFVATKSNCKQLYDLYKDLKVSGVPIFVTTDALLHTFHVLYDSMLRILEMDRFVYYLNSLNSRMLSETNRLYAEAQDPYIKELLRKNAAYFSVAAILYDPGASIPSYVNDLVNAELDLIDAHRGFAISPIFGYREDYSQYVPRGHYTRNEILQRYFRSMMWYGRMMFRLEPGKKDEDIQKGKDETLQAIYIVRAMDTVAEDYWDCIYTPTTFLVGKADDLTIYDYMPLIEDVYGPDWKTLPLEDFANDTKLTTFIQAAKELRDPSICSSFVWDSEEAEEVTKGFRLMGQRFIPDSYMFQQLVYKRVGVLGHERLFPKGLDVLSVLGSDRAYELLDQFYHETQYENYAEQMVKLKEEFSGVPTTDWAQNLYWNWLYCLMPLLAEKGEGYPTFMQNQAWTEKELSTALGSWAELRHDTILYAKQSYGDTIGIDHCSPLAQGYVEPNPYVFGRLASLTAFMMNSLNARRLLNEEVRIKLNDLHSMLLSLKSIAEKELTNEEISCDEYNLIANIGDRLEELVTFSADISEWIQSETDDEMAVIADVHTDPNTCHVLEEGVGYPLNLYVIVKIEGKLVVAWGGMFSYYEFIQPMSNRLTDEAWQQMLKSEQKPKLPMWMGSFNGLYANYIRPDFYNASFGLFTLELTVTPRKVITGERIRIQTTSTWPRSTPPVVTVQQAGREPIVVPMEPASEDGRIYVGEISSKGWTPGEVIIEAASFERFRRVITVEPMTDVEEEQVSRPKAFRMEQNIPNPFNAGTTIIYSLPQPCHVHLTVYDLLGQEVRVLADGDVGSGMQIVRWDGKNETGQDVSSGVYLCRLKVDGGRWKEMRKMVLVR